MQSPKVDFVDADLLEGFRVHQDVFIVLLVEILHRVAVENRLLELLARIERALYGRADCAGS